MSMLNRADTRPAPDPRVPPGPTTGHTDRAGTYLTDEVFLYRVVGLVAKGATEMVELEDCYWLDVVQVPVGALRARQLRVVAPADLSRCPSESSRRALGRRPGGS